MFFMYLYYGRFAYNSTYQQWMLKYLKTFDWYWTSCILWQGKDVDLSHIDMDIKFCHEILHHVALPHDNIFSNGWCQWPKLSRHRLKLPGQKYKLVNIRTSHIWSHSHHRDGHISLDYHAYPVVSHAVEIMRTVYTVVSRALSCVHCGFMCSRNHAYTVVSRAVVEIIIIRIRCFHVGLSWVHGGFTCSNRNHFVKCITFIYKPYNLINMNCMYYEQITLNLI